MRRFAFTLLLLLFFALSFQPARAEGEGWLLTARRTEGQSDIWAIPASGGAWQRLTETPDDERSPAWSPDGQTVAYSARRDRNWDIYTLELRTGKETRLTSDPDFDGWPAWSPDGKRLAFASVREGDLDLFLLEPGSDEPRNLTPESGAHDFEPRWEDNNHLLFVSTRSRSHDLLRLTVSDGSVEALTDTRDLDERGALPLGKGEFLALTISINERTRDLQRFARDGTPQGAPFSWTSSVTAAALSPQGDEVAWLEYRETGITLYRRALAGGEPQRLNGPTLGVEELAWGQPDEAAMRQRLQPPTVLATESYRSAPASLVAVPFLDAPQPRIHEHVLDPFEALRARLLSELGIDFLASVSETVRPVDYETNASDYLSWHKAGRAVDTVLYLPYHSGHRWMEIVRDEWNNDIYWRIWLRCPVQDGSCGEPFIETPWEYSPAARELDPEQGGVRALFQAGYYVDFTRLAADEGWTRISSYEVPDFDWRESLAAMEYWHYQHNDGLLWYDAMRELFTDEDLQALFNWDELVERETPRWVLRAKGVPLPPALRVAPAEVVIP